MKTLMSLTALAIMTVLAAAGKNVYADESYDYKLIKVKTLERAEQNLIRALKSNSLALQSSAVEVLFDIKRSYADFTLMKGVVPLMKVLRTHPDQNTRILAALILYDIQDGRGLWAIKEASKFDGHPTVRHICGSIFRPDKSYFTEVATLSCSQ